MRQQRVVGEIRFKVVRVNPAYESMGETKPPYVNLEIDQEGVQTDVGPCRAA